MAHGRCARSLTVAAIVVAGLVPSEAADTGVRVQAAAIFKPLPQDVATPENPVTPERVQLGRLLFFEPRVSVDGTVSCARCHQPALYGTDALPRSVGARHRTHPRNAQTVLNAGLQFVQPRHRRTGIPPSRVRWRS